MTTIEICDCGHAPSEHSEHTTGYGTDGDGKTYCYQCCAERDLKAMNDSGSYWLYLTMDNDNAWYRMGCKVYNNKPAHASNWPGSLKFTVTKLTKGKHNIAGCRYDAWFKVPNGDKYDLWHGVQYGDNTQILHCKRVNQ